VSNSDSPAHEGRSRQCDHPPLYIKSNIQEDPVLYEKQSMLANADARRHGVRAVFIKTQNGHRAQSTKARPRPRGASKAA